jgi:hypothetical protein
MQEGKKRTHTSTHWHIHKQSQIGIAAITSPLYNCERFPFRHLQHTVTWEEKWQLRKGEIYQSWTLLDPTQGSRQQFLLWWTVGMWCVVAHGDRLCASGVWGCSKDQSVDATQPFNAPSLSPCVYPLHQTYEDNGRYACVSLWHCSWLIGPKQHTTWFHIRFLEQGMHTCMHQDSCILQSFIQITSICIDWLCGY